MLPSASPRARTRGRAPGGQSGFPASIRMHVHSPPPRMRVASCHCRTYFRHLPTPSGVMLKEHMGSPAMVSAPSCSTTALGLNAAYTSFSTLWREGGVTINTARGVLGPSDPLMPLQVSALSSHTPLIPVKVPLVPVSPLLLSCSKFLSQSTHHRSGECKNIAKNTQGRGI